tara:strand:- start:3071 stop:4858 length:1788 start_codon:yes stop_codon:yes gene_type:complete
MKLLVYITFIGSLFAQSIDNEANERFIESLVDDINRQRNNAVIKRIDDSEISTTIYSSHAEIIKIKALYNLNELDLALNTAKAINPLSLPPHLKTSFYLTMGDIYSVKGYYDFAFKNYIDARRTNIDSRSKKKINRRIAKLIPLNLDYDSLELLLLLEEDDRNKNIILLAQSFTLVFDGSSNIAEKFQKINLSMLDREFRVNYNFLNRNIDSGTTFSRKVGVVLPLSDRNSEISNAFLKGLLEANRTSEQKEKIQFIVINNYSDPILTVEAFKELTSKHNVGAIIGPFSDENLIAGSSAISNINIPIFSPFSTLVDLSKVNKNIYLLKSSIDYKNQLLANHALGDSDLNNIAIIAPRTDLGIKEVDSFLLAMDKLNKEPVYIGWYEESSSIDLRPNFKELRDIAWDIETKNEYQEFLGVDIDVLDSMFEVDNNQVYDMFNIEEEDSIDSTKVVLETIDGIFYPINDSSLEFIASQVSLSNLDAQLMGNENWLDLDLLKEEAISPHISDMLFVSSYMPKYIKGNEFDYDSTLNNAFHFGLDFSNYLLNNSFKNGQFIFSANSSFEGITRSFNFSSSNSNISPKIIRFSNRKIYNAN